MLGSEFVIITPVDPTSLGLTESLLGAMEAFLATSDEADLIPHVERTTIAIRASYSPDGTLTFRFDPKPDTDAEIVRPAKLEFTNVEEVSRFSDWLRDTVTEIAARQFLIRDPKAWLQRIGGDERAFTRAIALGNILTIGRNVFGHEPSVRLSDWFQSDDKFYECLRSEPWRGVQPSDPDLSVSPKTRTFGDGPVPGELLDNCGRKHTERRVMSPIDIPLWTQAKWSGTLFATAGQPPPILGLLFEDPQAGQSIFAAWRAKWGSEDKEDALRIAIVTGLSAREPAHYAVAVSPNLDQARNVDAKRFIWVSRINRMTPASTTNLDLFLANYRRYGRFLLVPASMGTPPKIHMASFIAKRHLQVRAAWEIGENDPDLAVLAEDDDPIIPPNVSEPPVKKAMERIQAIRRRQSLRRT